MGGADSDPYRAVSNPQVTDAVGCGDLQQIEPLQRFLQDALAFRDGNGAVRFVFQGNHVPSFVVIANPALERGVSTRTMALQLVLKGIDVDALVGDLEVELVGVHIHR